MESSTYSVQFGIGEDFPGVCIAKIECMSREEVFSQKVLKVFKQCNEKLQDHSEDDFVWVVVLNAQEEHNFELEDELLEWLESHTLDD